MSITVILLSALGGAVISEMYHARMWRLYRMGKSEGLGIRKAVTKNRGNEMRK